MENELEHIAQALVAEGKGILAADESDGTIKKRFDSIDVESTEDNRRAYRELLFTTPAAEEFISGVILFDETIRQSASDGTPFPRLLESHRASSRGSRSTKARSRWRSPRARRSPRASTGCVSGSHEYRELGARFTKWRATYSIADGHSERVLHLGRTRTRSPATRR